jgi:lambda family phage tail tape measure protein
MRDAVGKLTTDSIGGLENSLTELATTGATNFKAFAASVLQDTTRMIIRQMVLKTIMSLIGGIGGGVAKTFEMPGAAFMPSGGYAFPNAKGNVFGGDEDMVTSPTYFKFANGGAFRTGVMGEAGPEAIMPLRRGRDGRLGVAAAGAAGGNAITINVDASGTKAEGNAGTGAALARDLARVVDDRLIHHRRPGGLLAA